MKFLKAQFVKGFMRMADDGFNQGWHERNGGNLSYRVKPEEVESVKKNFKPKQWQSIGVSVPALAKEYFLVTGGGKFFRNVMSYPEDSFCMIEIDDKGENYRIVWGLENGGKPTSELPSHLMNHEVKKIKTNGKNRLIYHAHPANIIALTFVLPLNEEIFTRELWESMTECPIFNNPAHNANAVAEFTVGLMLAETRNIARSHHALLNGQWLENYPNFGNIWEIKGRKIGIIGFSSIGRKVAEYLSVFGCKILVNDLFINPEDELIKRLNIEAVDLPTLMKESDIVTLHARSSSVIVTKEMISLMKPTAFFINTARAHMVDYDALYNALKEKKIMGAAIEVHPVEPLPKDYPFLTLDNVTLTSHRGGDTVNSYSDSPEMLVKDYSLYLNGQRPRFFVNRQLGFGK